MNNDPIQFKTSLQERRRLIELQEHYGAGSASAIIRAALEKFDPEWPVAWSLPVLVRCVYCDRFIRSGRENEHGDVLKTATATEPASRECSADDQEVPF